MPVLVALVALAVGCAPGPTAQRPAPEAPSGDSTPIVITTPELAPDQPVPAPGGPAALTITGRITNRNAGETMQLDAATLNRFGLVQVNAFEPWMKEHLEYRGVWLDALLRSAGPDAAAKTVHITALDNYQVDLDYADVMAGGFLVATQTGNGGPIPVEDGGPTRMLCFGDTRYASNPDYWIWSLASIDVR